MKKMETHILFKKEKIVLVIVLFSVVTMFYPQTK